MHIHLLHKYYKVINMKEKPGIFGIAIMKNDPVHNTSTDSLILSVLRASQGDLGQACYCDLVLLGLGTGFL